MSGLHDWERTIIGEMGGQVHSTHDGWTCRTCGHTSTMPKGEKPSVNAFIERWGATKQIVGCNELVVERIMQA